MEFVKFFASSSPQRVLTVLIAIRGNKISQWYLLQLLNLSCKQFAVQLRSIAVQSCVCLRIKYYMGRKVTQLYFNCSVLLAWSGFVCAVCTNHRSTRNMWVRVTRHARPHSLHVCCIETVASTTGILHWWNVGF